MVREVPKVLSVWALPKVRESDPVEGVVFAIDPQTGNLVLQVAVMPERFEGQTFQYPLSLPVGVEAAITLAHQIIAHYSPEVARVIENYCARAQLRALPGGAGSPTPEAS